MSFSLDVINHKKRMIKIFGVPGAGKTTEVINIASLLPSKKFLYLSFGRENTKSARAKMPSNVTSTSFHSLAKRALNIDSARIVSDISLSGYCQSLRMIGMDIKSPYILESFATLNTLFCMSDLTTQQAKNIFQNESFSSLSIKDQSFVLRSFNAWWSECWKPGATLPITHDMYFKHYSLTCSQLPFDCLVIDETQDLNNAMFYMSTRLHSLSPRMKTIRFGDPCQQLFGFRGSSEQFAIQGFDFKLENTHRFGHQLARLVNDFMGAQSLAHYTQIKSLGPHTDVLNHEPIQKIIEDVKQGKRTTFIAKYNISLWYMLKIFSQKGIKCSILGGIDNNEFSYLRELHKIHLSGQKASGSRLRGFTYARYKNKAHIDRDNAAVLACKFVENIGESGEDAFKIIQRHLVDPAQADVLLTTVHQAKGLEFEHLRMMDDFFNPIQNGKFVGIPKGDAYLIYTAMTRAKKSIALPKSWGVIV